MSEPERLDAPNQQVVRPDGSGPADQGQGGAAPPPPPPLDALTKDELLERAAELGIEVDASMTKAEIREAIGA